MSSNKILLITLTIIIGIFLVYFNQNSFQQINSSASIFGLFGEESQPSSSTGTYIGNRNQAENEDESEVVEEAVIQEEVLETEEVTADEESKEKFVFTRDLWFGVPHLDVMSLQRFLNREGFTLAETGPGSPGNETAYFGPRTFRALKRFQQFYQDSISAPLSMNKVTGYLDYYTRKFVETNF